MQTLVSNLCVAIHLLCLDAFGKEHILVCQLSRIECAITRDAVEVTFHLRQLEFCAAHHLDNMVSE
jgi:hypothetical protein